VTRSRKRTPIGGIVSARSEKDDKRAYHRRERRRVREVLATTPEPDSLPHRKELSDPWIMAKDGKRFLGRRARERDLRK
jgi:hypothetical protein